MDEIPRTNLDRVPLDVVKEFVHNGIHYGLQPIEAQETVCRIFLKRRRGNCWEDEAVYFEGAGSYHEHMEEAVEGAKRWLDARDAGTLALVLPRLKAFPWGRS